MMPEIKINRLEHRGRVFLCLYVNYNPKLIESIKKIENIRWSKKKKCWYMPCEVNTLSEVTTKLGGKARLTLPDGSLYKHDNTALRKRKDTSSYKPEAVSGYIRYLKGKRMSKSTIRTYAGFIADFFHYLNYKPIQSMNNRDIELFCEDILAANSYSVSTQRQFISAIKHLIQLYPECRINNLQLERPKGSVFRPVILSKEEVIKLLRYTRNLKHRAALGMIYSAGLRISELLNLRLQDIDFNRQQVFISPSKGRKDRVVILAESMLPLISNYISSFRPKIYFIEGQYGGKYSAESVRRFLKRSCHKSGITKRVTPHTLRHSYATHLLENGIDIRYIQELLGHSSPETTMIYTHVARKDLLQITSPLDNAITEMLEREKGKDLNPNNLKGLLP